MGTTRTIEIGQRAYLSDFHWDLIREHLLEPARNPLGGRPPHSNRNCLEGILYVLITGCQWEKLPHDYPSTSTCWRRFDEWIRTGAFEQIWQILLEHLDELGRLDWREVIADAWFVRAKKGAITWEIPSLARGPRWSTWSIRKGRRWPSTLPQPT